MFLVLPVIASVLSGVGISLICWQLRLHAWTPIIWTGGVALVSAIVVTIAIGIWYGLGGGREGEFFDPGVLLVLGSASILASATVTALFVACTQTLSVKRRFRLVFVSGYFDPIALSAVALVLRGGGFRFGLSLGWLLATILVFLFTCGKDSRESDS